MEKIKNILKSFFNFIVFFLSFLVVLVPIFFWIGYEVYSYSQFPEGTFDNKKVQNGDDPYMNLPQERNRGISNPKKFEKLQYDDSMIPKMNYNDDKPKEIIRKLKKKKQISESIYKKYPDQPESIVSKLNYYLIAQVAHYRLGHIQKSKEIREIGRDFANSVPEKFMKYDIIRKNVKQYDQIALSDDVYDIETASIDELLAEYSDTD